MFPFSSHEVLNISPSSQCVSQHVLHSMSLLSHMLCQMLCPPFTYSSLSVQIDRKLRNAFVGPYPSRWAHVDYTHDCPGQVCGLFVLHDLLFI
jgi:hypothetical protein